MEGSEKARRQKRKRREIRKNLAFAIVFLFCAILLYVAGNRLKGPGEILDGDTDAGTNRTSVAFLSERKRPHLGTYQTLAASKTDQQG